MRYHLTDDALWVRARDFILTRSACHGLPDTSKQVLSYLLYQANGGSVREDRSKVASLSKEAGRMVFSSPVTGSFVVDPSFLERVALGIFTEGTDIPEARIAQNLNVFAKLDYPMKFKAALDFLEKEMQKRQKLTGNEYTEDHFASAFQLLQEEMPAFTTVWSRQTLAKGLTNRGWKVRARREISSTEKVARDRLQVLAIDIYTRLGDQVGSYEFQEVQKLNRAQYVVHYGDTEEGKGLKFILTYGTFRPDEQNLTVEVELNGNKIYRVDTSIDTLEELRLEEVREFVESRWSLGREAAGAFQIVPDEVRNNLPPSLGPERKGFEQFVQQVYFAVRDFLRYQKRFFPVAMNLWRDQWNGQVFEFHFRGDREAVHVKVRGALEFDDEGRPYVQVEADFSRDGGRGWLDLESFFIQDEPSVLEFSQKVQRWLLEKIDLGLDRLLDLGTRVEDIIQTALTVDMIDLS